jgi:hypothetical protein
MCLQLLVEGACVLCWLAPPPLSFSEPTFAREAGLLYSHMFLRTRHVGVSVYLLLG